MKPVRSNWMDRTDIVVGVGMKNSEESVAITSIILRLGKIIPIVGTSNKSKSTELNKLYIETLQPITHYDENAKKCCLCTRSYWTQWRKDIL